MTFPGAHAQVYRNEAGEVTGYDNTDYDEPEYNPDDYLPDYDDREYDGDDDEEEEDEDWNGRDYDPGPECDDQGGMSEFIPSDLGEPPF